MILILSEGNLSLVKCSRCGGNVYEYTRPAQGFGRVVSRITGCTTFSCYSCGQNGWLHNGRSSFMTSMLARTVQGLIILIVALVMALVLFGVLTR